MEPRPRHLIVGLGGTGTRMLRSAMREFDQRGLKPRTVGYAVIDARSRPEVSLPNDVFFTPARPINFPHEHQRLWEKEESGLADWWPRGEHGAGHRGIMPLDGVKFSNGCGAYRFNGRFFVTYYAAVIERTLRDAIDKLTEQRAGLAPVSTLNVYLLSSLGNGTGAGIFMDIATMAADIVRQIANLPPEIVGVFVPGSTTWRHALDNMQPRQIRANGLASLIEIQHEANRRRDDRKHFDPDDSGSTIGRQSTLWAEAPRGIRTLTGRNRNAFKEWSLNEEDEAPLRFAILLDERNRNGLRRSYEDLIEVGGRSLAAFLSSVDPADRILDVELRAQQVGGPFGSWGFARMRSPVKEIRDLAAMELTLQSLDVATQDDLAGEWQSLLRLRGEAEGNIGFHESVERFIVDLAQIAEEEADHLFEKILGYRDEKESEWRDLLDEFERAERLRKPDYAEEMIRFIDESKEDFQRVSDEALDRLLFGDPDAPDADGDRALNSEQRMELQRSRGVLWLLRHFVVEPFVDAGAIAALKLWLAEFRVALARHRDSLARNERARYPAPDPHAQKELDAALVSLRETASDTFDRLRSMLGGGTYGWDSESVVQGCRDALDAGMWDIAILAVERFYDKLRDEVLPWADAAHDLDNRLNETDGNMDRSASATGVRGRWMKEIAELEGQLSHARTPVGYDLVIGDIQVARRVIAQLAESESTNPRVILRAFGDRFRRAFDRELLLHHAVPVFGTDTEYDPVPVDVDGLLLEMEKHVQDLVLDDIAHFASLESLLSEEARSVASDYEKIVLPARKQGTLELREEALQAQARFNEVFPVSAQEVRELLERGDPGRLEEAVKLSLHDAVRQLAQFAVAQWSIDHYAPDNAEPTGGIAFINYGSQTGARFRSVLNDMGQGRPGQSQSAVRAQEMDYASPHVLECVRVELGGHLDMLELSQEVRAYQDCRDRHSELSRNFSPHTTRAYEEAGLRWLESRSYSTESASTPRGAFLVALAEHVPDDAPDLLGWIEHNGSVYSWRREVTLGSSDVGLSFVEGHKLSTAGLADLVELLNSDETKGQELDALLCDLLWKDLETWLARGNAASTRDARMAPQRLADRLGQHAARIRRDSQADSTLHRLRRKQADQLQRFARTIAAMEPPFARPAILARRDR